MKPEKTPNGIVFDWWIERHSPDHVFHGLILYPGNLQKPFYEQDLQWIRENKFNKEVPAEKQAEFDYCIKLKNHFFGKDNETFKISDLTNDREKIITALDFLIRTRYLTNITYDKTTIKCKISHS